MEKLSANYATALFALAVENGATEEFYAQAALMRDALQEPDCLRTLLHPHVSAADKRELLSEAFVGRIHGDLLAFLYLVIEKNREAFLLPALEALIGKIEHYQKKTTANVLSAVPISEEQIAELKKMLTEKLDKQVEVTLNIDPSLIGGPYIYVDGYAIDWTVKKRLRDLTAHMKERCRA